MASSTVFFQCSAVLQQCRLSSPCVYSAQSDLRYSLTDLSQDTEYVAETLPESPHTHLFAAFKPRRVAEGSKPFQLRKYAEQTLVRTTHALQSSRLMRRAGLGQSSQRCHFARGRGRKRVDCGAR